MHADFGNNLDHISDEMCYMNIRTDRIARQQSHLRSFPHSPSPEPAEDSFEGRDDDDDASGSSSDDEITVS